MITKLFIVSIIIFLAEILNNINITNRKKDINKKHNYCFKDSKEYCPKPYNLAPRKTRFYSYKHVGSVLSSNVVVHFFCSFSYLSPAVNICNFTVKFFTRNLFYVLNSSSKLFQNRFLIWFSQVSHMWRKNFWNTTNVS